MIYNKLLQSKMVLNGDNKKDLAAAMGIRYETLNRKLKGEGMWTSDEIMVAMERYHLTDEEIREIFFNGKGVM